MDKKGNILTENVIFIVLNLVFLSILIAFATSLKLPLSTTYVTFMVAMGSSLADGAWGRESAVYRITGVLTVIAGWFVTALLAFTAAFIFALIISKFGVYGIGALVIFALFLAYKTHFLHKKRAKKEELEEAGSFMDNIENIEGIVNKCSASVVSTINSIQDIYSSMTKGLNNEDHKELKQLLSKVDNFGTETKQMKGRINLIIKELQSDAVESSHYYVQVVDYMREIAHSLNYVTQPVYDHVANNHKGFLTKQKNEIEIFEQSLNHYFNTIKTVIHERNFEKMNEIITLQLELLTHINLLRKKQIKRIKNAETGTKNSMLYLNIMQETKNLVLFTLNMVKAYRDFIEFKD